MGINRITGEIFGQQARDEAYRREINGPIGFQHIESVPQDGRFVRLRFRQGLGREEWEVVGQWQKHDHMPVGGAWFDRQGHIITPGPLFWAPIL